MIDYYLKRSIDLDDLLSQLDPNEDNDLYKEIENELNKINQKINDYYISS